MRQCVLHDSACRSTDAFPLFRRATRFLRIRPPAPHRRRKATVADARLLTGILHSLLRLLFASRKCKTFAVLLVPTELPHCSLIFAPRGGFAAFLRAGFLFSVGGFLPFADASMRPARLRVQINRHISAIPSRYALLTNPPTSSTSSPQGNSRRCPSFDGHLAFSPAAPLRVAKMQDVRRAPRSYGTTALLSHFCSAGRLCRFFMIGFLIGHEQNRPVADASMRKNRTLSLSGRRSTCRDRRT